MDPWDAIAIAIAIAIAELPVSDQCDVRLGSRCTPHAKEKPQTSRVPLPTGVKGLCLGPIQLSGFSTWL